jgi:hypothetical protein
MVCSAEHPDALLEVVFWRHPARTGIYREDLAAKTPRKKPFWA